MRILEALFVKRDAGSGELAVIDLKGNVSGGIVTRLLDFRLDPAERRRATERALGGGGAVTLQELGRALEPGSGVAAVLIEHVWMTAVEDAVGRIGGTPVVNDFVDAATLGDAGPDLLAAIRAGDRAASR
jgi:hypothetical protein